MVVAVEVGCGVLVNDGSSRKRVAEFKCEMVTVEVGGYGVW